MTALLLFQEGRNVCEWKNLTNLDSAAPTSKEKWVISLLSKQHVLEGASIFPQNGPEGNEKKKSEILLKMENALHRRMIVYGRDIESRFIK